MNVTETCLNYGYIKSYVVISIRFYGNINLRFRSLIIIYNAIRQGNDVVRHKIWLTFQL